MAINKALYSSDKMDWRTPREVLDLVCEVGPIDLDPCASPNKKHWFAKVNWVDIRESILDTKFGSFQLAFINPPYGRKISTWVDLYDNIRRLYAQETAMLVPARPDTQWFKFAWHSSSAYCFWEGRITFVGAPHPAPFPSVLFYAGPNPHKFCHVFQKKGIVGII